jgi:hypothetical protein
MTTQVRKVRKARHRLSKVANARDTIAGFDRETDVVGLTYGQFSLLDLIEATLELTGPADVIISTWSAGFYDLDAAVRFRDNGLLLSCKFLMDSSAKRGQATPGDVAELFGQDAVRTSRSHAKFVLIRNETWQVVITSSMNLNLNPRVEQFDMTDDPERYAFFMEFVQSVWDDLPEGWVEDRRLPPATGLKHVEPDLGLEIGKVTVGQWTN